MLWIVAFLSISVVLGGLFGAGQSRTAHYANDNSRYDFGRVLAGTPIEHRFEIINRTNGFVRATSAKSSCSCTAVIVDSEKVPLGGRIFVDVNLNTRGKTGPVKETVLVSLDNGENVVLGLVGEVEGDRIANLDFGTAKRGDIKNVRHFDINWPEGLGLSVNRLEYNEEYVSVVRETIADKRIDRFTVRLADKIPYGFFSDEMRLFTNDPVLAQKSVVVKGEIMFPMAADPKEAMLGEFKKEEKKRAAIRVFSPYEEPIDIKNIEIVEGGPAFWECRSLSDSERLLTVELDEAKYPMDCAARCKSTQFIWRRAETLGRSAQPRLG